MNALRFAPIVTIALLIGPVGAGLAGVVLPAFGYLPALGGDAFSLDPWRAFFAWPGLAASVRLALSTGITATALSLVLTVLIVAAWQGTRVFQAVTRALSPLLSVPHAAAAFGLAFLILPSGWIARALSPWATGWLRPPDLLIVNDAMGLSLIAGLVVKEVPFLLLMTIAALGQSDSHRSLLQARALGYGRVVGWLKVVLPRVYPQLRLPVLAVLAFSLSVVDVALILGPTRPPTLSVKILEWMNSPDLSDRFTAAAAALVQLGLVVGAAVIWHIAEALVARLGCLWAMQGGRGTAIDWMARPFALFTAVSLFGAMALGLAGLAVWSVAGLWRFPDILPTTLSLNTWSTQASGLWDAVLTTFGIGIAATLGALALTIACLEAEYRRGQIAPRRALSLLYVPLIVPQVAFLPGLTTLALITGIEGSASAVTLAHMIFVLPYVFLSLADPWRAWDRRIGTVAQALGAGPTRVLWQVRMPMLSRVIFVAAAVGFATSVAQYLPTLLIGAGRVETLTTEAVALAAGGNRRVIGAVGLAQMLAPFVAFALALALPAFWWRNRRGMAAA
jgi:putative thiamine transport system permease protein